MCVGTNFRGLFSYPFENLQFLQVEVFANIMNERSCHAIRDGEGFIAKTTRPRESGYVLEVGYSITSKQWEAKKMSVKFEFVFFIGTYIASQAYVPLVFVLALFPE